MLVSVRRALRLSLLAVASCLCLAAGVSAKPSKVPGWKTQVHKAKPLSILLVGNSHLLMPGFMKRVRKQLRSNWRRPFRIRVIAEIGTTLTKSRRKPETKQALRSAMWDIVVLQESTTAFMTTHGRRNYMASVKWFRKFKPTNTKILLWQTWPQGARHALYHRRGVWGRWFKNPPKHPKQLFSWIRRGTLRAANANAAYISPIGKCWMALPRARRPYAGDRYHPSKRGLSFVAVILARSIIGTAKSDVRSNPVVGNCP